MAGERNFDGKPSWNITVLSSHRCGKGSGPPPTKMQSQERPIKMSSQHFGAWRSLVAHLLWEQEVGGSNPSAPTNFHEFQRRHSVIPWRL